MYTFAGDLSGGNLLGVLFPGTSVTFAAILGLVVAVVARCRSRVLAGAGAAFAVWAAKGVFAPWVWASLGDGGSVVTATAVSSVVMVLLPSAALAALSFAVLRPLAPPSGPSLRSRRGKVGFGILKEYE